MVLVSRSSKVDRFLDGSELGSKESKKRRDSVSTNPNPKRKNRTNPISNRKENGKDDPVANRKKQRQNKESEIRSQINKEIRQRKDEIEHDL